ncbi:MAG TPA: GAF domain-containing protein, partial [Candidatus Binatia bacterium]
MSKKSSVNSRKPALKKKRPPSKQSRAVVGHDVEALKQELAEALEQQTATSEILRMIARSPTELGPVMMTIAETAARLCDADDALVRRLDGNISRLVAHFGQIPTAHALGEGDVVDRGSVAGRAIIDRKTVHVHDLLAAEADFPALKTRGIAMGVRTGLAVPLMREGVPIGAINIRRTEVRPFTDKQIALLKTFADQAVIAIENVRLFQESQARNREVAALHDVTAAASQSLEINPVLQEVVRKITEIFRFDAVRIRLFDPGTESLILKASHGAGEEALGATVFRRGEGIMGRVAETGEPMVFEDVNTDPRYREFSRTRGSKDAGFSFFAVFPIKAKGAFAGLIVCLGEQPRKLTPEETRLIGSMSDHIGVALHNINLFEELKNKTGELETSNSELREALEQQTATSEILRVIASSPTDIQPVLDTVIQNAVRLAGAKQGHVRQYDGEFFRLVAHYGETPEQLAILRSVPVRSSRAFLERRSFQVLDEQLETPPPPQAVLTGARTLLSVPLLREGTAVGVITIWRDFVEAFTERQIELVKTFADQAVIAIENVRLFQELQARNRDLTEALEQQTATSEVLKVISSSPTDLQPVFQTILSSITRLCESNIAQVTLYDGETLTTVAQHGATPEFAEFLKGSRLPSRETPTRLAALERRTVHVTDLLADPEFSLPSLEVYRKENVRTVLSVPLLREERLIGVVTTWRREVRPFTDKQVALVQTFADQAVIAIENVRLFQELKEALEQQTATSEILGVIASSPTDIQPVLDAIAQSAARVCGSDDATIRLLKGDTVSLVAHYGTIPTGVAQRPLALRTPGNEAMHQRRTVHVPDILAEAERFPDSGPVSLGRGLRTYLVTPLLREGAPIGVIVIRRMEVKPFTDKQIALLETFASQAVIAIENVRLFQELQVRNRDLTEALEQQTATSEILRVIASSPTDIQPVLDVVAENAARLCEASDAQIRLVEGSGLKLVASFGSMPAPSLTPLSPRNPSGQAALTRQAVHVHDLAAAVKTEFPESEPFQKRTGARTFLSTPMVREGSAIGVINVRRLEVRPFSERHIALLKTFADQAVIAIENVRLFQELQVRNRDLTEALEQQTATSEILRVISSSPTDVQPVMDTIAVSAARLCAADDAHIYRVDGDQLRRAASYGTLPAPGDHAISRQTVRGRAVVDRKTIHIHDFRTVAADFPERRSPERDRTLLATPLIREGVAIGVIAIRRSEVRPFSEKQIKLLETFADQAVIAIENVRLFQELQVRNRDLTEALEQQTATSEILRVIASSPTDPQPVFQTILDNAVRLCEAQNGAVFRFDGEAFRAVVWNNVSPALQAYIEKTPIRPGRESALRRVGLEKRPVHIPDMLSDPECIVPEPYRDEGMRTSLAVPLLKENDLIGAIAVHRREVRPFTDAHIKLVSTFADQAVIAIENVRLFQELQARNRDLTEALEQQTATSEILRVIASSPTDLQPVLTAVAENAARVCGAKDANIFRIEGDLLRLASAYGSLPAMEGFEEGMIINRDWVTGRSVVDRQTIHIDDLTAEETEFPQGSDYARRFGHRTTLATPLLREGIPIGAILIRRAEVRSFTDSQIKLLETFASQAVIAIENVRLFQELQVRNRDLTEALEQQTATSEILRVIASSPTDIQPVLDTVAENAARLCDALDAVIYRIDGESVQPVAHHGPVPLGQAGRPLARGLPVSRAILERQTLHIPDLAAVVETEYPDAKPLQQQGGGGVRTMLATPLLREGVAIGAISIRRQEVRPFSEKQIALLKTFADQAVIAIENVRLFQELQDRNRQLSEALEQQTATSEVLRVIASSPTDLQPVLDVVVANAARLCDSIDAQIFRFDGKILRLAANYGDVPASEEMPIGRGRLASRAFVDRKTIHIPDIDEAGAEFPDSRRSGHRTRLATPLLREGVALGVIGIRRMEIRPFTDSQIKLLETFADQAVIAIENVRLFKELGERNAELREALEYQTATAEVLGIISRSPTDVQPVLDAIVESAARVCGIDDVMLRLHEGDTMVSRAHFGSIPIVRVEISIDAPQVRWMREHGTLHIPDVHAQNDFPTVGTGGNFRTWLAAPLRQQGEFIGMLTARRIEVRPFTPAQIKLLETFADQAVIAIENVRLFNELEVRNRDLTEALEQQTATGEILSVISSSPTDVQPVFDTIVKNAARLCEGSGCSVIRFDGEMVHLVAQHNISAEAHDAMQ